MQRDFKRRDRPIMSMALVKYRTPGSSHNRFAVVPEIWLSDLMEWLKLSGSAYGPMPITMMPRLSDLVAPDNWPNYQACNTYMQTVNLLEAR